MSRIYVSSTFSDLEVCRDKVYRTLRRMGHDAVAMEDYVAQDERPLDACLEDVRNSDLYVGVIARRYGFVPQDGNPEALSITELEYREATKAGIPRLMFLLADEAAWPESHEETGESQTYLERFRENLKTDVVVSFFENCDELAGLVAIAVPRATELREHEQARQTAAAEKSVVGAFRVALNSPLDERDAAMLQWAQESLMPFVGRLFSQGVARRFQRRLSRKRDRERTDQLTRVVRDAVQDALKEEQAQQAGAQR
jgi:hypothetical protein